MRKIKEVLRLRFGLGLHQDQIARSCSIGQATVHRYLERAAAAHLSWPLPDDLDEQQLDELLFPSRPLRTAPQPRPGIDFAQLHSQLQTHKHLTLQLMWEEYRETHPDGYGYSRFCELYQRWNRTRDVVLRQDHKPGEKTFVDWAGDTVPIYNREGGEARPASIFVAVLGASTYTFARAALGQGMANWIDMTGVGTMAAYLVGGPGGFGGINGQLNNSVLLRERIASNAGLAGEQEMSSLAYNENIVVTVPGNTRFFLVLQQEAGETPGSRSLPGGLRNTTQIAADGSSSLPSPRELRELIDLKTELNRMYGQAAATRIPGSAQQ